jgi:two-component system sensor histidine kinase KdpD
MDRPRVPLAALPGPAAPPRSAYALAALASGATALVAAPLHSHLDLANTAMLFLLTVALVAVRLGRRPAILTTFLNVALFDFFFVPPKLSMAVSDAQYLITFAVMLAVALIISHLTTGLRRQAEEASRREAATRDLYDLAQHIAGAATLPQVLEATRAFVRGSLAGHADLLLADDAGRLAPVADDQTSAGPWSTAATVTAQAAFAGDQPVFAAPGEADAAATLHLPLRGSTCRRGVLRVAAPESAQLKAHSALLEAVASLVSTAVERLHFVAVAQESQLQMAAERLRSSILSALSHDVRTPLTALYGLADTLSLNNPPLPDNAQETAAAIRDQALRLNGMVANLLDMARLQAGGVALRKEWQPLEEVIGASIQLLGPALADHPVQVRLPADLPLLNFDAVLMERVFCNLLENAAKYSPAGTGIAVGARVDGPAVEVTVTNAGSGFPADRQEAIFELFQRGDSESAVPGMGLGLAICRAILDAHGGHIRAVNPAAGGACVLFTLPRGTPPAIEEELASDGGSA